ncbi:M3 family metallopeptidase [Stakelama sp. CBK3Z-3]|uniref:oligopeptidase A n=2 Tax=Stakelama flava TaxID=2860338 RepID=A0ABS6XRW0_9SPHN|nr:M3 family metallopeptidase [Stakelama flava]
MNSLLDPLSLPDFPSLTPRAIEAALDEGIAAHQAVIADLIARRPENFADLWLPYERAETMLDALWSGVSHLQAVADTPELRAAYVAGEERLVANRMAVSQSRELYDLFAALVATPGFADLPTNDRVAVERAIRNFMLSGVALDAEAKESFGAISVELSSRMTAFGSAVLDATDAWFAHITDEAELVGIPAADKAMFARAAASRSLPGWAVTLQQPSVNAVLTFAENRDLRARVYQAYGTRASDQGPHAGQFDNSARIARILELRHEAAALLGFTDPVALSLATKMATDAEEVLAFLRDIARRAKLSAERELAELREFAADALGIMDLEPWDLAFASNRLRADRYAIDEQRVRAYFPVEKVLAGWKRLLNDLFGIRLRLRDDVPLYHPDAHYYDVADDDGVVIAGLYVDLHAREGKRGGAWMDQARSRLADGNAVGLPVAYLVCNFAPTGGETPSLLSHKDVITLLHETGHALHLLLTRVDRPSIAGTSGFEWDAIELPSQLMEDFAWDRAILKGMSGHHDTGEKLPDSLFDRMVAARNFQSAMLLMRQIEFSLFDILLHLGTLGSDPIEVIEAVRDEVAVVRPPAWHRFPHAFNHIFAGAYAGGFYSYLWAEVLAADGFQRFVEAGLIDRATGDALRAEIFSRGASRPAAESFRAFRGREPDPAVMLRRRGLVDEVAA